MCLQPAEPAEGPAAPAAAAGRVPVPAPGRGRVPDGAAVQARPGAEAQDPEAGAVPAAASSWPLSHRGLQGRDF